MARIEWPYHGAVLNRRHGEERDGRLRIRVEGIVRSPHDRVWVNGAPAERRGERFAAQVDLTELETDLRAVSEGPDGRREHTVRVRWDRGSFPRYRVAIDDVSFSLREIARRGYGSIYECRFLGLLRRLHGEYGARFSVNLYYEADDGFRLNGFPERHRAEWAEAAEWLGLTFHAYADKPDRPYQYAAPEALLADLALVREEVLRFAGEESWIPPTIIHWGMIVPAARAALREVGVRVLSGYFGEEPWGPDVHYHLDAERSRRLWEGDALVDWESGLAFSRVDLVVNNTPLERIGPTLEALAANRDQAEVMDLLTHEQYFFEHYPQYIPDHPERLEAAIRWVTERGYRPVLYHEGFLGKPE